MQLWGPCPLPPPYFHLAITLVLTPGVQPGDYFKASKSSSLGAELSLQKDEGGEQSEKLHSNLPQ